MSTVKLKNKYFVSLVSLVLIIPPPTVFHNVYDLHKTLSVIPFCQGRNCTIQINHRRRTLSTVSAFNLPIQRIS